MLNVLLLAFGLCVVVLIVMFLRLLPKLKQSKSFTNTHEGRFVDPAAPLNVETVGHAVSPKKPSETARAQPVGGELLGLPAVVDLSVIVPAYNEENRIHAMLDETIDFLERRPHFTYEIVVVNDGSKDKTADKVLAYTKKHGFEKVRLMDLAVNCGKGAAINKGIRHSRGKFILFADADGATQFDGLTGLETMLKKISKNGLGCVCGSRYINQKEKKAERTALRKFVSKGFHTLVTLVCGADILDTQCGFKLFTRQAAQLIFPSQHLDRWAFDIEVLYLCSRFGIPMGEVQVTWTEIDDSKMTIGGAIGMARDILLIRFLYMFGIWYTKTVKSQ